MGQMNGGNWTNLVAGLQEAESIFQASFRDNENKIKNKEKSFLTLIQHGKNSYFQNE